MKIDVIIPAFNEEKSLPLVLKDIPKLLVREVIVVDNNSSDTTAETAVKNGATCVRQPLQGYGNACLKGMEYVAGKEVTPDVIVFLDADYSDHPEEMSFLIETLKQQQADLVIGSRKLGKREKGSMMPQQRFGNWLAALLIRIIYRKKITDLGPFRVIKYPSLLCLNMQDKTYGWTVEMQIKAIQQKMKMVEVPVSYRKRVGVSKITGTIKGTFGAGRKIIGTIFKYAWRR